jgi:hypothetical protein
MDGAGNDRLGWAVDGTAAGLFGLAAGFSLLLLGMAGAGVVAGVAASLATLAGLRSVRPEPRRFRLPAFVIAQGEAETEVLELTEVAPEEPLLLDDPLPQPVEDSRVVQLFAARPLPTPGELQQRIAAHLGKAEDREVPAGSATVLDLEVDAAAALRQSLRELRASLA